MGLLDSLRARLHRNTQPEQDKPPTGEKPEKKSGKKPLPEKRYRKPDKKPPVKKHGQASKKQDVKKKKIDWGRVLDRIANERVLSGLGNSVAGFTMDFDFDVSPFAPSSGGRTESRRRPRRRHGRRRGGRRRRR